MSSVVNIFHKGIMSLVLCDFEVQINIGRFILSESPPLNQIIYYVDSVNVYYSN